MLTSYSHKRPCKLLTSTFTAHESFHCLPAPFLHAVYAQTSLCTAHAYIPATHMRFPLLPTLYTLKRAPPLAVASSSSHTLLQSPQTLNSDPYRHLQYLHLHYMYTWALPLLATRENSHRSLAPAPTYSCTRAPHNSRAPPYSTHDRTST